MAANDSNGNGVSTKSLWLNALNTFGFPTVACMAITWFAYDAIKWERDQMMPVLTNNKTAVEMNTETMRAVKDTLDDIKKHLPDHK